MEDEIRFFGEVVDQVDVADIALDEVELVGDMGDVLVGAGGEVVDDGDIFAAGYEGVAEVAADEASSTGDQNAHRARLSARVALIGRWKLAPATRWSLIFLSGKGAKVAP